MKKIVSERYSNSLGAMAPKSLSKPTPKKSRLAAARTSRTHRPTKIVPSACHPTSAYPQPQDQTGSCGLRDRITRQSLTPPWEPPQATPKLGQVTIPTPAHAPQKLTARLDRCLPVPHLHITDPALPASYPVDPASVAGLADGAPVELSPWVMLPEAVIYQLSAPSAAFAQSMVGRVLQTDSGHLVVEALQPHGPFYRLRLEAGADASPGDVVVATIEGTHSGVARVMGKLQDPQSALTGICAIAADCGARFGHSDEAAGHAWNIRKDQRCRGPGMTDVPFFTLDPKGARVLDQAMHLERGPEGGYLLHYAIADGGGLVPMGSPCDQAAEARGSAMYLQATMPDGLSTALHMLPDTLTQDAGSLLEQHRRPAFVVTLTLDAQCNIRDCTAQRTIIQSLQQVTTQQVQWYYDNNMSSRLVAQPFAPSLTLLREVGKKLVHRAKSRGATSVLQAETMAKPDLVANAAGDVRAFEQRDVEVSQYNGQISMLVNEAVAAKLAQVGVLAPYLGDQASGRDDARIRAHTRALGLAWPSSLGLDEYLASLPPTDPRTVTIRHLVLAQHPGTAFSPHPVPHAALGLPAYTNVTAPLRRYQDIVVQRIVDAVFTGTQPVPYQDDASIAAVVMSANIGRERQRLIGQRTHGVRTAAFLRPHVGKTLVAKVVSSSATCTVVELEGSKIRLPIRRDANAPQPHVNQVGEVQVLAADVITRECQLAWVGAQASAA